MGDDLIRPAQDQAAMRLIQAIENLDQTLRKQQRYPLKDGPSLNRKMTKRAMHTTATDAPNADDALKSSQVSRSDKVKVEVRVIFLRIGDIDTQEEKYTADAFFQAKWREPNLNGQEQTCEDIDWDEQWTPKLYVDNVLGEAKQSIWYLLCYDENGQCTVYEKHRINGWFSEYLELSQFPFDTQDLTITVTSERSTDEIDLVEDQQELCGVNIQSFKDEQEWRLHDKVETWRKVTTKVFQNTKSKHPTLSVACKASRRPGFFIWNIFFVMFFIAALAFTTFSVNVALTQNRLQLSFILLLTTVTFKFIVNQNLPRISYLTYLDKYILITMTILCSVCMWHAILPIIINTKDEVTARYADLIVLIAIGSGFACFQLVFVVWIVVMNRIKQETLGGKEEEHENRQRVFETITDGGEKAKDTNASSGPVKANASLGKNLHGLRKTTPCVGVLVDKNE